MKNIQVLLFGLYFFILLMCGCKKFVEVDGPKTSVSSKNIFNNDATAVGAITALYVNMSKANLVSPGELSSLSCIASLSADELSYYDVGEPTLAAYYQNELTELNVGFPSYWGMTYQRIFVVNAALEGLSASTDLTPAVKRQLTGEARFMRAFYYFYLVNLYGDVPLVLTTDYTINSLITKSSKELVYNQIISDLKEAKSLLSTQYLKADGVSAYAEGAEERIRPTRWAANALLARVYLYTKDWVNAEIESSSVIENTHQYNLELLGQVFLKNNKEAIWQLQPINEGENTQDAITFLLDESGPGPMNPVYINEDFINIFSPDDQRKSIWTSNVTVNGTTYYYPYKYKITRSDVPNIMVNEYNTVLRLAEQFLIRAEAKAQQNKLDEAVADVDEIRKRAGLTLISDINPTISKENLLKEVLEERKTEFFTEWGSRWLDLKRTGTIDQVMDLVTPQKRPGGAWKSYQQYFPILLNELKANPELIQTPGYQ